MRTTIEAAVALWQEEHGSLASHCIDMLDLLRAYNISFPQRGGCNMGCVEDGEDVEWQIEEVMVGDGREYETGVLQNNVWYGSSVVGGGPGAFHRIDPHSLNINSNIGKEFEFPVRVLKCRCEQCQASYMTVPEFRVTRLQSIGDWRHVIRGAIMEFCRRNKGIVVTVGGPGERASNDKSAAYIIDVMTKIRATEDRFDCVPASIINAVNSFQCEQLTCKVEEIFTNKSRRYKRLGSVIQELHGLGERLSLRKPKKHIKRELVEGKKDFTFEWLSILREGVWVVRVCQRNVVDHCIAIDGKRRLILDSAERFPLQLCKDALICCCGDATNLHVAEIFEVKRYSE